jgi:SAM-dependent methyltransferase
MQERSQEDLVAEQFGSQAEAYLRSAVHSRGEDLAELARIVGPRPQALAADLGFGGGHVSFLLAPLVQKIVGYDLSEAMAATVRAEAARRGRYSAHHWPDVAAGLRQARRILKPGGLAVFMDVFSPGEPLLDTWLQGLELLRDPSHVRDYSLSEWRTMLEAAGFRPAAASRYRLRLEFSSWVKRMNTPQLYVEAIRSLQQRAGADVVKHFEIEPDGSFTIDTMLMTAEG